MEDKKIHCIEDLIEDACDELDDAIKWYKDEKDDSYYIDDVITEVADNNIPIYNNELIRYALHDSDLREPNDLAGENPNVEKIIIGNIFERLLIGLNEHSEEQGYE
tara:strand:+ start:799 stop:1116 length:318 start_codon:yes stop_codon:yes gene_type:complete